MNKKQMDSKKANKRLSKKLAPLVMSTSMMAATFLAAGAPISAAELDTKGVNPEVIEQVKNHGQEVSALAKSLPGSPEKGELVSKLAQDNSGTTNDDPDNTDNIDETNNDVPQEGEISDDTAAEEEGTAEETEAPIAEDGQVVEGTEAVEEDVAAEETEAPTTEDGQVVEGTEAVEEEVAAEETEAPIAEDGQVVEGTEAVEEDVAAEETEAPTAEDVQVVEGTEAVEEDVAAEELEVIEQVKNHGQEVSALAKSLSGSPEKGKLVSKLSQVNSGTTNDDPDNNDNIDETNNDVPQEGEISDDTAAEEEGTAEETEAVEEDVAAEATDTPTTLEADTSQDISDDNANTGLTNDTDVNLESPVVVENEDQPSDVETPEQETVESVENTVSDLEEPVQTVNEDVGLATETEQMSQNEVEKESDQISLKVKIVGYYQDLAVSFSNLINFLK
jgi:hypothetical protein